MGGLEPPYVHFQQTLLNTHHFFSVEQHYTGNKSRNAIVREDFPRAKEEQQKEEEEAVASYHQMIMEQ